MATTTETRPRIRRWTRMEYERLVELGMFTGERLELIGGLLLLREPQGARHSSGIRRVVDALRRVLGPEWRVDSQLPIALDDDSEPEPDVAVVAHDPALYRDAHPSRPALVVEVADSSYRFDRADKMSLYARGGVPEYWLVDLARGALRVHRDPEEAPAAPYGWRYRTVQILKPPATASTRIAPSHPIPVPDLLP